MEQVIWAERQSGIVGRLNERAWPGVFADHAAAKPGRRAKADKVTTNQLVLSLINFDEVPRLSDGKPIYSRASVETALGARAGRRRENRSRRPIACRLHYLDPDID